MNNQIFNNKNTLRPFLVILFCALFGFLGMANSKTIAGLERMLNDEVDLEISFSTSNAQPEQWSYIPLIVTVFNNSDKTATDIVIQLTGCDEGSLGNSGLFVQQFGYVYASSGASTDIGSYHLLDQLWSIPDLEPGATGQLEVNLFTLTEEARTIMVEVIELAETDLDSEPYNISSCTAVEDDEATLSFNSTTAADCELKATVSNIQCDDKGTEMDQSDDEYFFDLMVSGTNTGSGWMINGTGMAGVYNELRTNVGPFAEADGLLNLIVRDVDKPTCSDVASVDPGDYCSEFGMIDLELDLTQSVDNPQQWSTYAVLATLTNTGTRKATDIAVEFTKPNSVVYVGSNAYTLSAGSFNPNGSEVWTLDELAPGQTETIEVNYFLINNGSPIAYAQVQSVNEPDIDSTPDNGNRPIATEDDEGETYEGSGNTPADLTLSNLRITNDPVEVGSVLRYVFDISNIGGTSVESDFSIKAWISTDEILSADDVQDGIVPTGNFGKGLTVSDVNSASFIAPDLPPGDYYLILKVDADEIIFESDEENNEIIAPFSIIEHDGDPCNDIIVETAPGTLTISNTVAPHILKKVYNLNWNSVLVCLDDECDETSVVTGLTGGQYLVDIKLIDDNWNTICDFEEYFEVPSSFTGGNSSGFIVRETPSRPIVLRSIRPNPVYFGKTELVIFSKEEGRHELQCFGTLGRLETIFEVNLQEGLNSIPLDVSALAGGTYFLHLVGANWRQMPIKLVVVRE